MTMGEDLSTRVLEFISTVSAAMGLTLEAKVESTPDGPRVDLAGEDGELLLKHKAEGLLALQHIASAVFRQDLPGKQRVLVDCMGFRRDKDAELQQMAKYLAERARRTGAEQRLGPLNPYERRIVHMAVAEDGTVTSESIGDAFMKTVLISVKKR
jgi:spoIIIJ-associated protein